jgi:pimeloyl-ACP methyl ester carboxylesterase
MAACTETSEGKAAAADLPLAKGMESRITRGRQPGQPQPAATGWPQGLPMARRWLRCGGFAAAALLLTACAGSFLEPRPSPLPMEQILDDRGCARTQAPALLVLLPGVHMTPAEIEQQGFVSAVRQRGLAVDVVIAGTLLDHTRDGSVIRRLRAEVIAPARAQGYRQIWLAGISLGAYLALHYERSHPGEVQGLVLIAPYLGKRTLMQDIQAAGGPNRWRQQAMPPAADDIDYTLWSWLSALPAGSPPVWLATGREDRFAPEHQLLAELLPTDRVHTVPGGHDWLPWRSLWSHWLDRGLLPTVCP